MEPEKTIELFETSEENGKKNSSRYRILSVILCCVISFVLGMALVMHISGTTVKELELKALIKQMYDGKVNSAVAEDYEMVGIVS